MKSYIFLLFVFIITNVQGQNFCDSLAYAQISQFQDETERKVCRFIYNHADSFTQEYFCMHWRITPHLYFDTIIQIPNGLLIVEKDTRKFSLYSDFVFWVLDEDYHVMQKLVSKEGRHAHEQCYYRIENQGSLILIRVFITDQPSLQDDCRKTEILYYFYPETQQIKKVFEIVTQALKYGNYNTPSPCSRINREITYEKNKIIVTEKTWVIECQKDARVENIDLPILEITEPTKHTYIWNRRKQIYELLSE